MTTEDRDAQKPTFRDGMLLAAIGTLGPFAANTYVPAFGEIAKDFCANPIAVQQTLSVYLVAFAISSLFVGALSDAFGRRRVLLVATLLFTCSSVGAMLSSSIEMLMGWRLLMGIAASAGPVLSQAIVRDRWQGIEATKVVALIAILFGVGPCLAPIIGGEITLLFGWQSVFAFLALLGVGLCMLVARCLKETLPKERRVSFRPLVTVGRYCETLRSPAFLAGILAHGFCFMGLIVYSAGAADFALHILKLGLDEFAWMMIPLVGASMFGAWLGPRVVECVGQKRLVLGGAVILVLSGASGAAMEYCYPTQSLFLLLLFPLCYNVAAAVIRPTMNVMNLDYFPRSRGLAASLQQFALTSAFGISSAFLVPVILGKAWCYSIVMLVSGVMTGVLWLVVLKKRPAALPKD